jgi:hypothetical protein
MLVFPENLSKVLLLKPLPFHIATGFADLVERVHEAAFDERFPANGSFVKMARGERTYWYHMSYNPETPSRQRSRYAGAVGDPKVDAMVAAHGRLRADHKSRKALASSMRQSGLPSPDGLEGELALAFQKAGLFQAGAVLIGSVAYQTYGGILGVRLDGSHHRTQDMDIAQDRQVALHVAWAGQRLEDFESILKGIDPSFRPDLNPMWPESGPTRYRNDSQYKVDLLTEHLSSDRNRGKPIDSLITPGMALQPLDMMDYLIQRPIRSVLLHDAGAAVVVPDPARYAIHKIVVSQSRSESGEATKSAKDLFQVSELIRALRHARKDGDLADAWSAMWQQKAKWRRRLIYGALELEEDALQGLAAAVMRHGEKPFRNGSDPAEDLHRELK